VIANLKHSDIDVSNAELFVLTRRNVKFLKNKRDADDTAEHATQNMNVPVVYYLEGVCLHPQLEFWSCTLTPSVVNLIGGVEHRELIQHGSAGAGCQAGQHGLSSNGVDTASIFSG
jgi:hypothetical protein